MLSMLPAATFISLFLIQIPLVSHVFPVFPDGLSADAATHTTALILQNPNINFSAGCSITFYQATPAVSGPDGRLIRSYFIQQSLPAGGFNVLKSAADRPLANGYVKVWCSHAVNAYTIYSVMAGETVSSEATISSSLEGTGFQFVNDSRQGGRLALAFANDNLFAALVQVTVGDLLGRTLLVHNLVVPAYSTFSRFLDEIAPNLPRNHVGAVVIRSNQRIYTTGLRFTGSTVTGISPAAQLP